MDESFHILVINPGSTSTKVALYDGEQQLWKENIQHKAEDLQQFSAVWEQYDYRKNMILELLESRSYPVASLKAVVGRGGLLKPLESGTYEVNQAMLDDVREARMGEHASNLGAVIAWEIAGALGLKSYIVDPVCVDELEPLARFSGLPQLPRESIFHALNMKSVARRFAAERNTVIQDLNLIVAHMGGGTSVAALRRGKAIQVDHGIYEGAFSPERCGNVPNLPFAKMCFSGEYDLRQIGSLVAGKGGMFAYLGTSDAREVERMIEEGDNYAYQVYEAFAYQIAQEIGARAAVLCGNVDYIILTGGLAYSTDYLNRWIEERVKFIAPVVAVPGENEMEALALGALRVLKGEEEAAVY